MVYESISIVKFVFIISKCLRLIIKKWRLTFTLFYTVAGLCRLDVLRILGVPLGDPGSDEFTDPVYEAADRGRHVFHLSWLLDLHVVVAVRLGQQVFESSDSPVLEAWSRGGALETVQDREPGRVDGEHLGGCRGDGRAPDLRTAAQNREHGHGQHERSHGRRSRTLDTQTMPRPLASTRLYQQSGGGPNVARFCISFLPSSFPPTLSSLYFSLFATEIPSIYSCVCGFTNTRHPGRRFYCRLFNVIHQTLTPHITS